MDEAQLRNQLHVQIFFDKSENFVDSYNLSIHANQNNFVYSSKRKVIMFLEKKKKKKKNCDCKAKNLL